MICTKCNRKVRGRPSPFGLCKECRPSKASHAHICTNCHRAVRGRPSPTGLCPQCRPVVEKKTGSNVCSVCHRTSRGRPSPSGICKQCRAPIVAAAPKSAEPVAVVEPEVDWEACSESAIEGECGDQTPIVESDTPIATDDVVPGSSVEAPGCPTIDLDHEQAPTVAHPDDVAMDDFLAASGLPGIKSQRITDGHYKGSWRLYRPGNWNASDAKHLSSLGFTGADSVPLSEHSANGAWIVYVSAPDMGSM